MTVVFGTHRRRPARRVGWPGFSRVGEVAKHAIALFRQIFFLRGRCALLALASASAWFAWLVSPPRAVAAESPAWRQPASVTWSGATLRDALQRFADSQSVYMVIDRRIDPGARLELGADRVPVGETMRAAGKQADASVSFLGAIAYFGPESTCRRIATVAALRSQECQKLPSPLRTKLLERSDWNWEDFATPRELIEQLAASAGLKVDGMEQIPHDLWAGAKLPSLNVAERLTIVLAQFDLTFRLSEDRATLVLEPIPERVAIEKDYPAGSDPAGRLAALRKRAPEAEIELRGKRIVVRGTVEDHQAVTASEQSKREPAPPVEGVQVYTLTVTGKPLNAVLPQLARQLQFELKVDEEALKARGATLDHLVSLEVKEVALKQLLDKLFQGTGLEYQVDLEQKTLEVK